ncbi:zinc-finger of the MIZ type in Nse subunit-domain-containing protein [Paraphoma chrysanthemicola]|uniref:Zinc-finger of the MIZ type in Nse subunit-domain-containing protein n=1 Tax=Paraphoma chrysanthemicola TaxID=798071 RepID=A0A8K0QXR4_9PLEO|nr:zinc-finger of the MIZ type in Nse subunit-domain-containing protein [Paraphoma chrysanthemicola]
MSSRIRTSNARPSSSRPSAAATPSRNVNDQLPPYKKPSHPLDLEATRQLRDIQGRNLNDVKRHNKQAQETITASAASVNDMLREHTEYLARRQKKWDAGKGLEDREDEEREMERLQAQVEEATAKLEESMRAVLDSGFAAQRIDDTLDWLRQNAPKQLDDEYQTQISQRATQRQSQIQNQRRQDADGDEEMSDEDVEDGPTPGPTPLDGTRVSLTGVSELFKDRQQRQKDAYTSLSLTARYARNNEYRDFKRIVHDAKFGDDGPVLGHEDTWFTETGSPAPGTTNTQRGDLDDDDDIIMDKATISTRCPITFQQYKEPYTSTKCPHTFEKNAILEMIRSSPNMVGGAGPGGRGVKGVSCPVAGCSQMLTQADLRSDPILIRKIKRMQQAEAAQAEESSEDEEVVRPKDHRVPNGSNSRLQVPSTQQPPQSSIVEDLGDPSDDESEMQQPPMGSMVEDLGDPSDSE